MPNMLCFTFFRIFLALRPSDDIDQGAVTANYAKAQAAAAAAASGSVEEAEAMIDMEVNKAMAVAVGITLQ